MKRILIALTLWFSVLNINAADSYKISGQIEGLNGGDTLLVKLAHYYASKMYLDDSAYVSTSGKFEFAGDKDLKGGIYLIVLPNTYFEIIMNDERFFSFKSKKENIVKNLTFKNHQENSDFYTYLNYLNPRGKKIKEISDTLKSSDTSSVLYQDGRAEIKKLSKEIEDFQEKYVEDHPSYFSSKLLLANKEVEVPLMESISNEKERRAARYLYYKNHYFDNYDLTDTRYLLTPFFHNKVMNYMNKVVVQSVDSITKEAEFLIESCGDNYDMFRYFVITFTKEYENPKIMCMDEVFYNIAKKYYLVENSRVDWIKEETQKKIAEKIDHMKDNLCGMKTKNLILKDTTGAIHQLYDVNNENIILVFWSATCGHCKKMIPKLHEMYLRTKDEYDVQVFSVCIDADDKEYKKFLKKYNLSWMNTHADKNYNGFRQQFNVFSTPTVYLLNSEKEIIGKKLDVEGLEKIIIDRSK